MKIFIIILLIIVLLSILPIIYTAYNMIFVAAITERKLKKSLETAPQVKGVIITEISENETPWSDLPISSNLDTGDITPAKEMVL